LAPSIGLEVPNVAGLLKLGVALVALPKALALVLPKDGVALLLPKDGVALLPPKDGKLFVPPNVELLFVLLAAGVLPPNENTFGASVVDLVLNKFVLFVWLLLFDVKPPKTTGFAPSPLLLLKAKDLFASKFADDVSDFVFEPPKFITLPVVGGWAPKILLVLL